MIPGEFFDDEVAKSVGLKTSNVRQLIRQSYHTTSLKHEDVPQLFPVHNCYNETYMYTEKRRAPKAWLACDNPISTKPKAFGTKPKAPRRVAGVVKVNKGKPKAFRAKPKASKSVAGMRPEAGACQK